MNVLWVKSALIRALKTVAQTAVALIGTGAVGVFDVDWKMILSASVLAGILSLLTSVAGLPEVSVHEANALADKPELDDNHWEDDEDIEIDEEGGEEDE